MSKSFSLALAAVALWAGLLIGSTTAPVWASAPPAALLVNDSYTQTALATDLHFQKRVAAALANVAWQVINENENTPNHIQRKNYARTTVLPNVAGVAAQISTWLVQRPNVLNFATSYDFPLGAVVTASGDADIQSQLLSDWDILAGV